MRKSDPLEKDFSSLTSKLSYYFENKMKRATFTAATEARSIEDQFADLVAAELKKMPEDIQKEKKKKILAILYDM